MEMTAAGWSNPEIAGAVSAEAQSWFELLAEVAQRAAERFGSLGPFSPREVAALAALPFLGAEAIILLGLDESKTSIGKIDDGRLATIDLLCSGFREI